MIFYLHNILNESFIIVQHPGRQGNAAPTVLQWKATRTISQQVCQQRIGSKRARLIVPETVCAASPDGKGKEAKTLVIQ